MSDNIYLEFTAKEQEAIVGHLFGNYSFFQKCRAAVKFAWFQNPEVAELVKLIYEFWDALDDKRKFTTNEIKGKIGKAHSTDIRRQNSLNSTLDLCLITATTVGLDVLSKDMTGWLRIVTFKNSILKAEQFYNRKEFSKGIPWVATQMQEILQLSFEADDTAQFKDVLGDMKKRQVDHGDCLTIGHPDFDALLMNDTKLPHGPNWNPNNLATQTKGGLAKGDTTVLVGSSNAGKTSTIISIIFANIFYFKRHVLYYTHEQKGDDIKFRLLQCFTLLTSHELSMLENHHGHNLKAAEVYKLLDEYLTYVPWTKPTKMFVEDVLASIETKQEEMIAKTGKGYDLFIDDYPGKLKAHHFATKHSSGWEEQGYIYDRFVNLALHYKFHAILATQTNREGYKINRGDADRMIDQDDIAKSYEIAQIASNVITINRSNEDIALGVVRFFVAKCRSNDPKWTFVTVADYNRCRTHGIGSRCKALPPGTKYGTDTINELFKDKDKVASYERESLAKLEAEMEDKPVTFAPNPEVLKQ